MKLPENATATDVIDLLSEEVMRLVDKANVGRGISQAQYAAAFARTFAEALPTFIEGLRAERPELAARLVEQFVAEEENRMAELPPARKQSWPDQLEGALRAVFSANDVEILVADFGSDPEDDGGMGALSCVLRSRCHSTGETPIEVLKQLAERDLDFAMSAKAPGAFLASRVQHLPQRRQGSN